MESFRKSNSIFRLPVRQMYAHTSPTSSTFSNFKFPSQKPSTELQFLFCFNILPPSLIILPPSSPPPFSPYSVIERGNQVKYTLSVQCHHSGLDVTETWSTRRQFSDFHDFHMTLRNTVRVYLIGRKSCDP